MRSVKTPDAKSDATPVASEDELKERLAVEIEKSEKLAASQLHMAEWFLAEGKTDIAKRRLQLLLETLPDSSAAQHARKLIKKL